MLTRRAGNIMIPIEKYPNIFHTCTLRQAAEMMEAASLMVAGRKSLPRALIVFDEEYHPLGTVRRRDILRGLEPKFLRTMSLPHRKQMFEIDVDPNLVDFSRGKIGKAIQEQAEQHVSDVMRPIVTTVDYSDHLAKVIYKMLKMDLCLIPVLKDGKVVGVVRSVDVFHEVADILVD